LEEARKEVVANIQEHIYGFDDDLLEQTIGNLLKERNLSIATAESCTGGYLAHLITSVSGSSVYFKGSILSVDGQRKAAIEKRVAIEDANELGMTAAKELLQNGGKEIADSFK